MSIVIIALWIKLAVSVPFQGILLKKVRQRLCRERESPIWTTTSRVYHNNIIRTDWHVNASTQNKIYGFFMTLLRRPLWWNIYLKCVILHIVNIQMWYTYEYRFLFYLKYSVQKPEIRLDIFIILLVDMILSHFGSKCRPS